MLSQNFLTKKRSLYLEKRGKALRLSLVGMLLRRVRLGLILRLLLSR